MLITILSITKKIDYTPYYHQLVLCTVKNTSIIKQNELTNLHQLNCGLAETMEDFAGLDS
jgi:hypothetical protein